MILLKSRREREKIIVNEMIRMFCKDHHSTDAYLCETCTILSEYAEKRLLSCIYSDIKPVCKNCPVHCYSPNKKLQMTEVMRWSGPGMMLKKPTYAMVHFIDSILIPKPYIKLAKRKIK